MKLIPVTVPAGSADALGFGVESAAFFDELIRSGRDKQMTNIDRETDSAPVSALIPAVEYLLNPSVPER